MTTTLIKSLLMSTGYFVLNKKIIAIYGITEAALLSLLVEQEELHADDEGWFFLKADDAMKILHIGRRPFESALGSLVVSGVVTTKVAGVPAKKWFKLNYNIIYSQFVQNEQTTLYNTDNLSCTNRTNIINKEDNNKEIDIIKGDDEFEKFWNMYDRKVARPHCERMWAKLTKAQKAEIFERLPAYIQATPDKQFRMHPATYINPANKRWQDEIIQHEQSTINRGSDRPTANTSASSRPNTENATVKRERNYNFSF